MINVLLNIYTASVMISIFGLFMFFLKMKRIMPMLDVFKILGLEKPTPLQTAMTYIKIIFIPLANLFFGLFFIIFTFIPDEVTVNVVNEAVDKALEVKEKGDSNEDK